MTQVMFASEYRTNGSKRISVKSVKSELPVKKTLVALATPVVTTSSPEQVLDILGKAINFSINIHYMSVSLVFTCSC